MRARLAAVAVAALTLTTLSGCGLGGGGADDDQPDVTGEVKGSVTLQTWALKANYSDYIEKLVSGFEKKYPGTKVHWKDQPGDGYADKVLNQASQDELPDVVNLPPDFAYPLAKQGLLLDVKAADDRLTKEYVSGGIDAYKYPGVEGTYGYPWYLNTDVNYWNKTLMKKYGLDAAKPPTTLDELIAQAKTMRKRSHGDVYLMSRMPTLADFVNAGVKVMSNDGKKFTFNTSDAVKLLDKYRKAYGDGLLPPKVLNNDYEGNSKLYVEGKVAWTTGGGNFISDTAKDNPSMAAKTVPSTALDTPPLYVQGMSVSKKSKNLPTAVALARWVTSATNQKKFAKLVPGIFPSTKASAKDPFFSSSDGTPAGDAKTIAFSSLSDARLLTPPTINDAMNKKIAQQIALAMSGKTSSAKALDSAVDECDKLLND
ncbi:MAG TPA: extracellular solute-binding protein [Stackebrandtia sp.]|jgi:multiple sugar transport system substrate-binding protein|uniref:ABC transporter substrate-binding protein n=1 Tax=Stackebrandtia sp. TaxID=2023065 RepID=UPI002D30ECB8|nr:extracellular solute-binding protein [Stackebrandtia sp.]HZE40794.1 extracellular solute-binding protein [Stackebrandtia sp.]